MAEENRRWLLRQRPDGALTEEVFELVGQPRPEPGPGEVLVRVRYLSLDPANRVWMAGPSYRPPVTVGDVMAGFGVGEVVASNDPRLTPGRIVSGDLGWQDYACLPSRRVSRVDPLPGVPLSYYLGVLGVTGLTAYFGLFDVGRPRPGETVLVSAAAGATGSIAAQLARIAGCRVVGIAGGPEKCRVLVTDFDLDGAIDYRKADVKKAIKQTCPEGVDVYFDNVGGKILEAALHRMRLGGRIVCCGAISSYDKQGKADSPSGVPSMLIGLRLRMEGFIVLDYMHRRKEAIDVLSRFVADGKIVVKEDRVDGLENAPKGLMGLLGGANVGKRYIQL